LFSGFEGRWGVVREYVVKIVWRSGEEGRGGGTVKGMDSVREVHGQVEGKAKRVRGIGSRQKG
jgi:hypothetical protein